MVNLFFILFYAWINRDRATYILQVLNFAIVTLENFLPVLHIAKSLTESLKAA